MSKYNATITGVGGYVPEYIMTNQELAQKLRENGIKFAKENVDWEIVGNKLNKEIIDVVKEFNNGK